MSDRNTEVIDGLKSLLGELAGQDLAAVEPGSSFLELGFDSLFLTQAATALKNRFGVKVTFRQLMEDLTTIGSLAEFLSGKSDTAVASAFSQTVAEPRLEAVSERPAVALPVGDRPMAGTVLERVMKEQLRVMEQQLTLLRSSTPSAFALPAGQRPVPVIASETSPATSVAQLAPDAVPNGELKASAPQKKTERAADARLSPGQVAYLETLIGRYTKRTAGSKALTQKYRKWYADPRTASGFNRVWKEMVYQVVVTRSSGSKLWDIDGNEYIDLLNGFGPSFLGHSPDFITDVLKEQLAKGIEVGPQSPLAGEAAKMFCEFTGNERASFVCTGSEAVYAAMRLARTVTGRDKIVVFTKDYHGNFDEVLVRAVGAPPQLRTVPSAPGIPKRAVEDIYVLDYGTDAALEFIRDHSDQIAAVLVEPVQSRRPEWRPAEFIKQLRALTTERGCLLIFDEVITGLRSGPGGAQAFYGVKADLATCGKVVGAGIPLGIVAGKSEYMDTFDGGFWQYGDDSFPSKGVTFFAGTFVRHPLAIAAVHAMLKHLKVQGPEFWNTMNSRTSRLAESLDRFFIEHGIPIRVPHFCSQMFVRVQDDQKYGNLLFYRLREKGIFLLEGFPSYLTAAHSEADVDQVISAFKESALELVRAGLLTGTADGLPLDIAERSSSSTDSKVSIRTENSDLRGGEIDRSVSSGNRFPLTDGQLEMWLATQISPEASGTHNASNVVRLRGNLDLQALRKAIGEVIDRHESLRSTFDPEGAEIIVVENFVFDLPLHDLTDLPEPEREKRVEMLLDQEGWRMFDLVNGPLFSFQLIRLSNHEHLLAFTVQMIVCDGWGYNIVLEDVGAIYSALVEGRKISLPQATPMREYVRWQRLPERAKEIADCEAFWVSRFSTVPPALDLPLFNTRPPTRTFTGNRQSLRLSADLFGALKKASKEMKATPFSVLLAAYYSWLYRLSGQADLVVGVPFAGQAGAGVEKLVGQCVHTLPIRATLDPSAKFTDWLRQTREAFLDAQEYWNHGFGNLVQKLDIPRDSSRVPLVSVIFNLDVPMDRIRFSGCETTITAAPRRYFQYDLGFNLVDEGSTLLIECDFNSDLFDGDVIREWLQNFQTLLQGAISNPSQAVGLLRLHEASNTGGQQIDSPIVLPQNLPRTIHQMISEQVLRVPDQVAVESGSEALTYGELDSDSNQLANLLRSLGVEPGEIVGVCVERGLDMVVAVVAVLKAGGAYLPIEPDFPASRIASIIQASGAKLILTHGALVRRIPTGLARLICLDEDRDAVARESVTLDLAPVGPENLAYVMFTSGSTGRPKGVEITHGSVVNFLESMKVEPGLRQEDVVLALTMLAFDISVLEIFLPLVVGAKCIVVTREVLIDPYQLEQMITKRGVTVMQATPATWRMLHNAGWRGDTRLKVLCGGEAMVPDLASRLVASCREVWNMYGPTETTVWSMASRMGSSETISLGRPIANTWVCVVDDRLQPVCVGVAGELLIGGTGLARGYLNAPDLTQERFIPNVTGVGNDRHECRCYRTGDLVRRRPNGEIEFIGRRDHQVKLRGHRIELGEIEAVLLGHEQVRDAVARLSEGAGRQPTLVAYVVRATADPNVPFAALADLRNELRCWLRDRLPEYMCPAAFAFIDQVPRTANGKMDRTALPDPDADAFDVTEGFVAPRSAVEKKLALIWSEVLNLNRVGIRQSFFELGGQSLLAVSLFRKIENEFSRRLPLVTLLRAPTIEQLAEELADKPGAAKNWASLVPIQPKGTKPILFLVHGAGGNVLLYRALAEHLAPDFPLYGLQSRGMDGASRPLTSIEEMAAEYLKEIRSVQPVGPYYMGGYCLGGTVAYEMAQLLHQAGEKVALVAMLDTYNFSKALKAGFTGFLLEKVKFHLGNFLHLRPREMMRYLAEKVRVARDGELANILTSRPKSTASEKVDGVARAESGIEASVQAINDEAADRYLPNPFPGKLALFKPHVNYKFYPDPKMGWGDLVMGGIEVIELPVNPHAMLVEPFVSRLAGELKKRLEGSGE